MATQATRRNQLRGFVVIWTAITFLMGAATFLAIYFTYSGQTGDNGGLSQDVALPVDTTETAEVVVIPSPTSPPASPTPIPTETPVPTDAPTTVAQAAAPTTAATATSMPPTPTPTLLPVENRRFQVGSQVQESPDLNPDNQDGWYNSVANDLGLNWVKQQVRWEIMEPEEGNIDWSILDLVVPSAQKHGLKLMLSVVTTPDWAREAGVNLEQHGPPADPQDYADFVAAILNRYPGQIHAVEVWNEQNIDREWTSNNGVRAEDYVELLRVTHDTIKSIDPGVIVISGALSPTGFFGGCTQEGCDDQPYLEELLDAGLLNYADCVGAHHNGYNISPSVTWDNVPEDPSAEFRGPFENPHPSWSFRSTLQGYATRIARAGGTTKLCVTEFGWASSENLGGTPPGFGFAADNTLEEQADFLIEALNNMQEWDTVWLAFIWNFNYGPQAGYNPENDNVPYSLIGPDFNFRPAYDAIREWQTNYLESLDGGA